MENILSRIEKHDSATSINLLSVVTSGIKSSIKDDTDPKDLVKNIKFLENMLTALSSIDLDSIQEIATTVSTVRAAIKDDTDPKDLVKNIKFLENMLTALSGIDLDSIQEIATTVSTVRSSIKDQDDAINLIKNIKFLETTLIATKNNSLNELCNMLTGIRSSIKNDNDTASLIKNIKLLKNLVFTVKNNTTDTDLKLLHSILVAIKNNDNVSLIKLLLEKSNDLIDLSFLEKVLIAIKHNSTLSEDILDSFSTNQFNSKGKLLELIDNLDILDNQSNITIFGCWYGSILIPKLLTKANKITGIDADDAVIKIAKNQFFKNVNNLDFITSDVFSEFRSRYKESTLFINTSCEHMLPMKDWPWWGNLPNDAYFAFQSNDMDQIEGHVNCVGSLEEFKAQLPPNSEVLFEDELADERGTRYTLVGKITAS